MGTLAIHVRTKNDAQGSPRYGWLITDTETGEARTFISGGEGFQQAFRDKCPDAVITNYIVDLSVQEFMFWCEVEKKK